MQWIDQTEQLNRTRWAHCKQDSSSTVAIQYVLICAFDVLFALRQQMLARALVITVTTISEQSRAV